MRLIRKKVREEIERGHVGSDETCEYYPCHYEGQDCTFCYCPFYPCEDTRFGRFVKGRRKTPVWDCSPCLMIHDRKVALAICKAISDLGITDPEDIRFKDVFGEVSEEYLGRHPPEATRKADTVTSPE